MLQEEMLDQIHNFSNVQKFNDIALDSKSTSWNVRKKMITIQKKNVGPIKEAY